MKTVQRSILAIFLFIVSATTLVAQVDDTVTEGGVNVGVESRAFTSQINNKNYKLHINLPQDYETKPEKTYPVFYVLDGQWDFANIVPNFYTLEADKMVPKIIIVGITYDGENPNYEVLRANDYTPTAIDEIPNTGGAPQFLEVLRDEILPLIDQRYRTNKVDRALGGNSFGGLFTHYALFNAPELFNSYIIINPSLWVDNQILFKYEEEFFEKNKTLNAKVLMVGGEFDGGIAQFKNMVTQIESRGYEGLDLENRILEGLGHNGVKAEAFVRGMLHAYKRETITLTEAELQPYVGAYEFDAPAPQNFEINIISRDGILVVEPVMGQPEQNLYPLSTTEFTFGDYTDFYFTRDENGSVIGLSAEVNNQVLNFKKKETLGVDDFDASSTNGQKTIVHPNPGVSFVYIENVTVGKELNIYNITGQEVLKKQITSSKEKINVSTIKTGVYLVKIDNKLINKIVIK